MNGASRDPASSHELSTEAARHVARLARLALTDAQLREHAAQLGAILGYVEQLRVLDLSGVEPMAHAGDAVNRLDDDVPRAPLAAETLMRMAPESAPPFIRVPKVIGDAGGSG